MIRRIGEMEFSCQTRWLNYELENARDLGGMGQEWHTSTSVLVLPMLLAGKRDRQMWKRERRVRVNDSNSLKVSRQDRLGIDSHESYSQARYDGRDRFRLCLEGIIA
jgi:hypothetical protein